MGPHMPEMKNVLWGVLTFSHYSVCHTHEHLAAAPHSREPLRTCQCKEVSCAPTCHSKALRNGGLHPNFLFPTGSERLSALCNNKTDMSDGRLEVTKMTTPAYFCQMN